MMRSLYSGVSGLQNHQTKMDVIGNNISNVNTIGFKKGRVTFQDIFSQYLDSPSAPNQRLGGVNPKQVGLGMSIASIDTLFTEGSLQMTGVKGDLAITGNGFFVLRSGERELFTRAGAFDIDSEGRLVNPANGMRVQGWNSQRTDTNYVINTTGSIEDIQIPIQAKDPANATTQVLLRSNLNKNTQVIPPGSDAQTTADNTWVVEETIYDAFGVGHLLQMSFTRNTNTINQWDVDVAINPNNENNVPTPVIPTLAIGGQALPANTFQVTFDNQGLIQSIGEETLGVLDVLDRLQVAVTFDVPNANPVTDTTGFLVAQTQQFNIDLGNTGQFVDSVTQFASESSTKIYSQDGYTMGYLQDFSIDQLGNVVGKFSNDNRRVLAKIALASFSNPEGLEKTGDTNFTVTSNSGLANIGEPATLDRGFIQAGKLEMSNVDIAEEFTDMIVTQRGFQANSRTIRTSDQMIQELLTLKQ